MNLFLHFRDLIKSRFSGGVICTLLLLLISATIKAQNIENIASFSGTTISNTSPSETEWSKSSNCPATTYYQLTANNIFILSPTIDFSNYYNIQVTIKARQYGGPSGNQGVIHIMMDETDLGTISPTNKNLTEYTTSITTKSKGHLKFICSNASNNKGCGISEITIKGIKISSIFNLTETSATINAGETYDLSTKITKIEGYNGTITYSSDSKSIATVDANGVITGIEEGTANITITASADGSFTEQSETFAITVVKPDLRKDPAFSWSKTSYEPYFDTENKTFPTLSYTQGFNEIITYSSNNEAVATINNNGEINILSAGETTITASFAGNDNWQESTASYILNIKKHITELSFGAETVYNVNLGETFTSPKATATPKNNKEYDGTITYSSSDTNIADVNATTGEVEIKNAGTVTITATAEETNAWTEATANYILTVIDPNFTGYQYKLIESQDEITDGSKFLLAGYIKDGNNKGTYALSDLNKNNFYSASVTIDENNIINIEEIDKKNKPFEITINKIEGGYTLKLNDGRYLSNQRTKNSGSNYLKTATEVSTDNGTIWTITLSGSEAIIENTINNISSTIRLNKNDSQSTSTPLFSCYGSGQTAVSLYKKIEAEPDLTINFTKSVYTTYVAPCDIEFPNELSGYIVTDVTENSVITEEILTAPKGTPVIIKANELGTYKLVKTEEVLDDVTSNKLLASDGTIKGGNNIYAMAVKSQVGFYRVKDTVTIPAGKAYLVWEEAPAGNAKEFIPMGGETTGITNIAGENGNAKKVYYNLNGMRVDKPQKGIYIVNGKKVIF